MTPTPELIGTFGQLAGIIYVVWMFLQELKSVRNDRKTESENMTKIIESNHKLVETIINKCKGTDLLINALQQGGFNIDKQNKDK